MLLGRDEDVVPQPRLEVALQLGQVEIRPGSAPFQRLVVVCQVQREVEDRRRSTLAVDQAVLLGQVPAARADDECRRLVIQLVSLTVAGVRITDRPIDRVAQIHLSQQDVFPRRRTRVFEVGHEAFDGRIQRVDDHLAIDRTGDLDAAVLQVGGDFGDPPVVGANGRGLGEEVRDHPVIERLLPQNARLEQLEATRIETLLQNGQQRQCIGVQDLAGRVGDVRRELHGMRAGLSRFRGRSHLGHNNPFLF